MSLDALARLSSQRRVFDRLDWWPVSAWVESDAWAAQRGVDGPRTADLDAALLIVPLDLGQGDVLAHTRAEAGWVRWCGVADGVSAMPRVRDLFARAEARLAAHGVRSAWCIARELDWLVSYLPDLGYRVADRVVTYQIRIGTSLEHIDPGVASPEPRLAAPDDLDAICALDDAAFEPAWRYPPAIMGRALAQAQVFTVVEQGGMVLGYQCALLSGGDGHVVRLAVGPRDRRRGIGRALLRDALARLAQGGATTITLNTPQRNTAAQALYAALGFRALPEQPRVFWRALAPAEAPA